MNARLLGCALVLLTSSCASGGAGSRQVESSEAESSDGSAYAITLYRSPCYGGCPVYSLSVTTDGQVRYEGTSGVRRFGTATARIPESRVDALQRELEAAGYFRFASRYRPSEPVCGRYVPDAPTVITTLTIGNRTRRIEHDHGCGSAPMALGVLESRIDEVLGSKRWTGR
jgi:hypothetical protein